MDEKLIEEPPGSIEHIDRVTDSSVSLFLWGISRHGWVNPVLGLYALNGGLQPDLLDVDIKQGNCLGNGNSDKT